MHSIPGEIIDFDFGEDDGGIADASDLQVPFRLSMRRLAAAVSIVSFRTQGEVQGLTATSVTSLSMNPPSLMVALRRASSTLDKVLAVDRFAIHILSSSHRQEAEAFAGRLGSDGRNKVLFQEDGTGRRRLPHALADIQCRVARRVPVYSHLVLIGGVQAVFLGEAQDPMLYFEGDYRRLDLNPVLQAADS